MSMDDLFEELCQNIVKLDAERIEPPADPSKDRAPFKLKPKGNRNFVIVHKEAKRLKITLNVPRDELDDPHRMVEDNPAQNKGTAETMVIMNKKAQWPKIQPLIKQSFDRLASNKKRMPHPEAFSIHIFATEGQVDGLRTIKQDNWNGMVIVCPRSRFKDAIKNDNRLEELARPGVYVLFGFKRFKEEEDDDKPMLYIGQTGQSVERLNSHFYDTGKAFWQRAVVLTKTHDMPLGFSQTKYLESRLYELAKEHDRVNLSEQKAPKSSSRVDITEAAQANAECYLRVVLPLMPFAGIDAFKDAPEMPKGQVIYRFKESIWDATGFVSAGGFTVLKGSTARAKHTPSCYARYINLRNQLKGSVLVTDSKNKNLFHFKKSHEFNSPSQAASVVAGSVANGPRRWKVGDRTFNEIERGIGKPAAKQSKATSKQIAKQSGRKQVQKATGSK